MSTDRTKSGLPAWVRWLDRLDRRIVYVAVMLSLLVPILFGSALKSAEFKSSQMFYDKIENLEVRDDELVLVAMDWSPSTKAENEPQTAIAIEHLMKRRIKFAVITTDQQGVPFLINLPQKVADRLHERTGETWEYGKDWVNLGYRPGRHIMIQQFPKSPDLHRFLKVDARNTPLSQVPCMRNIRRFSQIPLLIEITGFVMGLEYWLQFFQTDAHRPPVIHGCTSITIPQAYIFLDSGQLEGLLEGMAGCAHYAELVGYTLDNPHKVMTNMTALSLAHFVIIAFIIVGNIGMFLKARHRKRARSRGRTA